MIEFSQEGLHAGHTGCGHPEQPAGSLLHASVESTSFKLVAHPVEADLVVLVDGHGPVCQPVCSNADGGRNTRQDAAVIDQNAVAGHAQRPECFVKQTHQLELAQDAGRPDYVRVALDEFLIPTAARSIAPPHRLHLIPLEGHR